VLAVTSVNAVGFCGDPLLEGFDGKAFVFNGQAGHSYLLLSNPYVAVNALVVPSHGAFARHNGTVIDALGVITRSHNITVTSGDYLKHAHSVTINVNGQPLSLNDSNSSVALPECISVKLERHKDSGLLQIHAPEFLIRIKFDKMKHNGNAVTFLNAQFDVDTSNIATIGGILGATTTAYNANWINKHAEYFEVPALLATECKRSTFTKAPLYNPIQHNCAALLVVPVHRQRNVHHTVRCPGDNIGYACTVDADCSSNHCSSLMCATNYANGPCVYNADCTYGNCGSGTCGYGIGTSCSTHGQCKSNNCDPSAGNTCQIVPCFTGETPVMKADGALVLAKDIKLGDMLRGNGENQVLYSASKLLYTGDLYGLDGGPKYFTPEHKFINPANKDVFAVPNVTIAQSADLHAGITPKNFLQIAAGVPLFKYFSVDDTIRNTAVTSIDYATNTDDVWVYNFRTVGSSNYGAYIAGGWLNGVATQQYLTQAPSIILTDAFTSLTLNMNDFATRKAAYITAHPGTTEAGYNTISINAVKAYIPTSINAAVSSLGLAAQVDTTGAYNAAWFTYLKTDYPKEAVIAVIPDSVTSSWYHTMRSTIRSSFNSVVTYPCSADFYHAIMNNMLNYYQTTSDF